MEKNEQMTDRSNKVIWIVVIVILVLVVSWFYFNSKSSPITETAPAAIPPSGSGIVAATSTSPIATVREFTVVGTSFAYSPSAIAVNRGDRVKIIFKDNGGFHDFVIEGLNVASKRINSGQEDAVEFTADKTGSFEYYCSVDSHRAKGMRGTLTVK